MSNRLDSMSAEAVQEGNRSWWTRNTMSYDWKDKVGSAPHSLPWFDEIDKRFVHGARLFATDKTPFDRIIPFAEIAGKNVLEIGCGMGLHTELMTRAGANVSAVDISPTSVEVTRKRLALKGLAAEVREADAEKLPFPDASIDFVWSWGVIHHSARTSRIVREIARVLKPQGACRIMVYNRKGIHVPLAFVKDHLLKAKFLRQSFEETLYRSTDGFSARFYVPEQFADLFSAFFTDVEHQIVGQDSDAIPLPRILRRIALKFTSKNFLVKQQAKWGSFIFVTASKPF